MVCLKTLAWLVVAAICGVEGVDSSSRQENDVSFQSDRPASHLSFDNDETFEGQEIRWREVLDNEESIAVGDEESYVGTDRDLTGVTFDDEYIEECYDNLLDADADNNSLVDEEEYVTFINTRSNGMVNASSFESLDWWLAYYFYFTEWKTDGKIDLTTGNVAALRATVIYICTSVQDWLTSNTQVPTLSPTDASLSFESLFDSPTVPPVGTPSYSPTRAPSTKPTTTPSTSPSSSPSKAPTLVVVEEEKQAATVDDKGAPGATTSENSTSFRIGILALLLVLVIAGVILLVVAIRRKRQKDKNLPYHLGELGSDEASCNSDGRVGVMENIETGVLAARDERRVTMVAPAGDLGIVLGRGQSTSRSNASSRSLGPVVVRRVNPSSPLHDVIQVGDILVEIDELNTSNVSARRAGEILRLKSDQPERSITVLRQIPIVHTRQDEPMHGDQWVESRDPFGRISFYNETTGEMAWTRPPSSKQ